MFKKINTSILICDKCKTPLDIFEEGTRVFLASNSKKQLIEYATKYDTWEEKDGKYIVVTV